MCLDDFGASASSASAASHGSSDQQRGATVSGIRRPRADFHSTPASRASAAMADSPPPDGEADSSSSDDDDDSSSSDSDVPSRSRDARTLDARRAAAAASIAAMNIKRAATELIYPPDQYVVLSVDPGRTNPAAATFKNAKGDYATRTFTRAAYYAYLKVGQRKLLHARWNRANPAVAAALADVASYSAKTASPMALRAHIAAVGRSNGTLWPHKLRRRVAQDAFAAHRAKCAFVDNWGNAVFNEASQNGKLKVMVAYGDGAFPSSGRGEPGGAPTSSLMRRLRFIWNRPGATFDVVHEFRTSSDSSASHGQQADVHDPRAGHCLEKRARKDARAERRAAWVAWDGMPPAPAPPPPPPLPLPPAPPRLDRNRSARRARATQRIAAAAATPGAAAAAAVAPTGGAPGGRVALPPPPRPQPRPFSGRSRRAAQRARAAEGSARRAPAAAAAAAPATAAPLPSPLLLPPRAAAQPGRRRSRRASRRQEWARHAAQRRGLRVAPHPPASLPVAPLSAATRSTGQTRSATGRPRRGGAAAAPPSAGSPIGPAAAEPPAAAAPAARARHEWPNVVRGIKFDPLAAGGGRFRVRDGNSGEALCDVLVWSLGRQPGDPERPPYLSRGPKRRPLTPFVLSLPGGFRRPMRAPPPAPPSSPPGGGVSGPRPTAAPGALAHSQRREPPLGRSAARSGSELTRGERPGPDNSVTEGHGGEAALHGLAREVATEMVDG